MIVFGKSTNEQFQVSDRRCRRGLSKWPLRPVIYMYVYKVGGEKVDIIWTI